MRGSLNFQRMYSILLILLSGSGIGLWGWEYNIDDGILFKTQFLSPSDSELLSAPDLETVIMTTNNNEKYKCTLPRPRGGSDDDAPPLPYEGPNALKLLEGLFVTSQCAYRLEPYWTYELCHGTFLRQFHEDREGKEVKVQEYYLGRYTKEQYDIDEKAMVNNPKKPPPKIRVENMNMPYLELIMTDGTVCDINGRSRITRVLYICYPAGKHEIYSFKESSTCEYEAVVLSPILCKHPDYRPEESNVQVVSCHPADGVSGIKPKNLLKIEEESLRLKSANIFEAEMSQGNQGPGSVKIEIKPVNPHGDDSIEFDDDGDESKPKFKDSNWPKKPQRPSGFKPLMDPEVVEEFLMGEYCLYGGSGWWKYEFCYGKSVIQYHEENGRKTEIKLGEFNLEEHLGWLKENPHKRPKSVETRKHVSHYYSNGDVCDLTKKPRHVEIKLKCKKSDSPSTVSLYLLEPKTCQYVLGIESPLVCDILHLADENGLMDLKKTDFRGSVEINTSDEVEELSVEYDFTKHEQQGEWKALGTEEEEEIDDVVDDENEGGGREEEEEEERQSIIINQ